MIWPFKRGLGLLFLFGWLLGALTVYVVLWAL